MGYDVYIICDDGAENITSISYNWSDLFPSIHEFYGHNSEVVARLILAELAKRHAEGIFPYSYRERRAFEDDNSSFMAGIDKNHHKLPLDIRMRIHCTLLLDWLEIAYNNPRGRWYTDQKLKIIPNEFGVGVPEK
jgi:hypothetical protein